MGAFNKKSLVLKAALLAPLSCPAEAALQSPSPPDPVPASSARTRDIRHNSATDTDFGEIIVTARKSNERLQDVPLTVTALSSQMLKDQGIRDIRGLQDAVPGLTFWQQVDRSYGTIFIRGMVSTPTGSDTTRELASMFIDGIYYVGTVPGIDLGEVERVEVVKGPQSALYGRSTFSGAINYITKKPSQKLGGTLDMRLGSYGDHDISGSLEGALVPDKLSARVYGRYREYGGAYTNTVDNQKLGREQDKVLSATLFAEPTPGTSIKLRGSVHQQSDGPAASQLVGLIGNHNCGPFNGGNNPFDTVYCGTLSLFGAPIGRNSKLVGTAATLYPFDFGMKRNFKFLSSEAKIDLGGGYSLASLTGYSRERLSNLDDVDRTGADFWAGYSLRNEREFSQEVRLSSSQDARLSWLIGAFYLKQHHFSSITFLGGALNPFGGGAFLGTVTNSRWITNYAGFGSFSYSLTDKLNFSAEGRYQSDDLTVEKDDHTRLSVKTPSFLPRLIMEYKPSRNLMLYANVAKGNRPIQLNAEIAALSPANQTTVRNVFNVGTSSEAESVWNYEVGLKSAWLGGKLVFNAAAFWADWKNKQVNRTIIYDFNGNGVIDFVVAPADREFIGVTTANAGRLRVYGFEFETSYSPTRNLSMGINLSYAHNKIRDEFDDDYFRLTGKLSAAGQQPPYVPEFAVNANLAYKAPLSSNLNWFARGDLSYQSKRYADLTNTADIGRKTVVNVRAGLQWPNLTLTAFVDNLFDDRHFESVFAQGDSVSDPFTFRPKAYEVGLARPRSFGISANVRF